MKKDIALLRDIDGNIVLDEISMSLVDLEAYSLCLDMLSKRFDESSLDLNVFFHIFREVSSYIEQRAGELKHDFGLLRDYALDDIPVDLSALSGMGA